MEAERLGQVLSAAKSIEKTKVLDPPAHARNRNRHVESAGPETAVASVGFQQTVGNLAIQRLFASGMIQAKLTVSQPNDPDEEEADRVADQVMHTAEPDIPTLSSTGVDDEAVQRKCAACPPGKPCPKCHEEQKVQTKELPGHTPHITPNLESSLTSLCGGGQPLPPSVRAFFEPRFRADFSQVRVHTDARDEEYARAIQARAFTVGRDMVFGAGEYAPGSASGQHLLAHELSHVIQQAKGPGLARIYRKVYSTSTVKKLLEDTPQGDVPGEITSNHGPWLAKVTDEERISLLSACLVSESRQAGQAIDLIWFRCENWQALARANNSVFKRSLIAMTGSGGAFFRNLMDGFLFDTEEVARGYLDMNETYCVSSLAEMAYDREGKPIIGPPTAAQQAARQNPVELQAAKDLVDLQEKLQKTRKIVVGYHPPYKSESEYKGTSPPGGTGTHSDPIWFTPNADPKAPVPPKEGDGGLPWPVVKEGYDEGVNAIRRILSLHPKLYVLVRENFEDSSKTGRVARDQSPGRSDTLQIIAKELAETIKNIEKVRPLMGKAVAGELAPIHEQLLTGSVTSPRHPTRNWVSDPTWKAVGDAYVEHTKPAPWWQQVGLAALEMGVFLIAGLATGGVGFAAAMAAKGALEAAKAAGKSQIMTAASLTNVSADTALVTSRQVEEAETEVAVAAASAVLDALMVGVELRAVGAAARLAKTPGMQAARAIEMSERILKYEKKLLGRIAASEAEIAAKEARVLATDARRLAEEARAAGGAKAEAGMEGRARLADKAAKRAEDAAERVEKLADGIKRAEQAKVGIPEAQLAHAFEISLADGGKLVITKSGQVFICVSPCSRLVDRFADVIARNPQLATRAKAFEMAESQAQSALANLKGKTAEAVKVRMKSLAQAFEKECVRYKKAEVVAEWLKTAQGQYPGLAGKPLDAAAIARVLEKGPGIGGMKGQLLEEFGNVEVEGMLRSATDRAKLAGEFAGEELIFIPGYRLRDARGSQLTDGIVGFWKGDTFQIVNIIEAKAGAWAAEGLRYGEAEISAVRSARHRMMGAAYKRGDRASAKVIREMKFTDFVNAHRKEVDEALRRAESDSDWARAALDDVRDRWVEELRAAGKKIEADAIADEKMGISAFKAKYPAKAAEAEELIPLPEAGQFTRDLERTGQIGGKIMDTGTLPTIVEDGKLAAAWKSGDVRGRVPAGTGKPTSFVGSRGSVRMRGFTTSDVDTAKLAQDISSAERLSADVTGVGLSSTEMENLSKDILTRAKAVPK